MAEEKEYLRIPGHISVKEAADILGVSNERVLQHIRARRLPYREIENRYMIPEEAVRNFHSQPHGRTRARPVKWRKYRAGAKVRALQIEIQPLPGRHEALRNRLQAIASEQTHQFQGTMLRHVFVDENNPDNLMIELIWKNTELTDEAAFNRDLETFRAEFADVLDWQTARYTTRLALIHT